MTIDWLSMVKGTKKKIVKPVQHAEVRAAGESLAVAEISAFRRKLMQWYQEECAEAAVAWGERSVPDLGFGGHAAADAGDGGD